MMNGFDNLSFNQLFGGADELQKLLNAQSKVNTGNSDAEFITRMSSSSPHSDKLDSPDTGIALGDYSSHSPDQAVSPSDRDETPTSLVSPSDSNEEEKIVKQEPNEEFEEEILTEDQRLQRQILRLTGMEVLNGFTETKSEEIKSTPSTPVAFPNMMSQLSQHLSSPPPFPPGFQQQIQQLMAQGGGPLQAFGLPTPNFPGILPPMTASSSFSAAPPIIPSMTASGATNPDGTPAPQKRKRQRRNPVWPYFDVIDGTARCKQCLYSTKSVFSTNLKVHLRSHHRADYDKVIEAEDALNLNALLLSGNAGGLLGGRAQKRQLPPMTSSILHTINKLATQAAKGDESNALNSVLRQTLAAGNLQQQMQQAAKTLPFNMQNAAAQLQANFMGRQLADALQGHGNPVAQPPKTPTPVHHPQSPIAPLPPTPLSAASTPSTPTTPAPSSAPVIAEQFFKQFNIFPAALGGLQSPSLEAPQPKRRRLRRHPVWMFFRDLEDRMVGCISCNFRTGSAFSTNLKMHLKAHHKEDYHKVMKLEDEMRIEEGILHPNKIKSELIDFIRGGGNASQIMPGTHQQTGSPTAPRPSPLVQQFISQTLNGCQANSHDEAFEGNQKNGATADIVTGCALDEETLSKLSMGDRLAALVGGFNPASEESTASSGEVADNMASDLLTRLGLIPPKKEENAMSELRRAAERVAAASRPANRAVCNLADVRSVLTGASDTKTSSSASSEGEDVRKNHRDRALAKLVSQYDFLLGNSLFRDFVHVLAPDYEVPEMDQLVELHEGSQSPQEHTEDGQIPIHMPALLQ
ncbi:unnamed protein product, partial [Mesorhabditis belari]|uniref:BED-type domain-containing protein n=1 Tax=Mesorhabditis belari TaxID=2138241 RepID=A0AAF3EA26_9BILA